MAALRIGLTSHLRARTANRDRRRTHKEQQIADPDIGRTPAGRVHKSRNMIPAKIMQTDKVRVVLRRSPASHQASGAVNNGSAPDRMVAP